MRNDHYPSGTVQTLLQTDFVLPQTKEVLQKRLDTPIVIEPSFFSNEEFSTLQAVCKRLLPQPHNRKNQIDLAGILDTNCKENKTGNGWRYDVMPTDEEAYHQGLQAIEQSSRSLYGKAFQELSNNEQDELLQAVQQKTIEGKWWNNLPSNLFFEKLMASLVEIYYSHPIGKDEIGDASFADAKGWHLVQLNEREEREPEMTNRNDEQHG